MDSNIMQFFMTRKFWEPIIQLILTVIVWAVPQVFKVDIPPEVLAIVTAGLWAIAGFVVHGDIRYDWINAQNARPSSTVSTEATTVVYTPPQIPGTPELG